MILIGPGRRRGFGVATGAAEAGRLYTYIYIYIYRERERSRERERLAI